MSKIDCESQNETLTLPSTLTSKSFNFGSSFLGNSEDSFFIDPEDHISKTSRPSFFENNFRRGSVFVHAQQRITQIIQERVTKARKHKHDEIKDLEDRYFGLINLSSSLLWYTTILILILYILQMELLASYSPILNSISRLSGKLNTSLTDQDRSANYIYQNVQPNCWNIYLEDDVLTEHWSDLKRKNMIDELNDMFNSEFPEQLEGSSAFDSLKYKPKNWLKKYTTDENIDLFVKVPKPNNSTYRIPMSQLTEHSSDYDLSQYCKIMFHILVAVQCLLACNYHYANYNLRSLHHVMSASTMGSGDNKAGDNKAGKTGGNQSKIHRQIENKLLLKFLILDLLIFSCFYSMYGIFIRFLRIWWLYSREIFREQKLSRKIRLNADQKVLRLFWFKYKFRHHPLKIVIKVCGSMMLVVSWILFLVERYNGYCRSFSWQFWAMTGAMTGVGLDQVYKKTIYDSQMQIFIYILTLTYGIFWTGLIVSVVMDLFNFPMQTGELEIEKVRCREQMEKAAARFLLSGWRRFVIKKEIAELISINNELVNDHMELAKIKEKHQSEGNANKLEGLEEQETEMTRKMYLMNDHLIWLGQQATLFRNKRGILHRSAAVKEAMSTHHNHDSDSEDEHSTASREHCNIAKQASMDFSSTNMLRNKIYEDKRYKPGQPQQAKNVNNIGPKSSNESSNSENKVNSRIIQTTHKISKESNATVITNTPISATKLEPMKQCPTNLHSTNTNHSTNKLQQKIDKILKTVDVAFKDKLAVWREKRIAMQNQMDDIDDDINQAKTHATTQKMMHKMDLLESQNKKVLKKLEQLEAGSQGYLESSVSEKADIAQGGGGGYVVRNTFSKTSVRTGVVQMYK